MFSASQERHTTTMDSDELMAIARDVEHTRLDPTDIMLTGRRAVVTGGGGGIGQAISLGLARFGADVGVIDIVPERCAATAAAIERLGRASAGIPCDVMDGEGLRAAIRAVSDRLGGIDILVNNAGGVRSGPFVTMPDRSMRRHVDLNLFSFLVATQEAAHLMIEGGRGGSIVNVTSIEGFRSAPTYAVYAACKAAMVNFTRTMAVELSDHAIRVNCIAPDRTITPGLRGNLSGPVDPSRWGDTPETNSRSVPLGREGLADECATTVIWLCSSMSAYVTGDTIHVDGGTWASGGWVRGADGRWVLDP
jgi:NAD(P)-dependent dehydrogenase (short-subunit alcohol dehydrogenase family)